MLTLNDGRAELWQWDTGRTLSVDADCSQVHFSNNVFGRSIDVNVVDGVAIIPDILLQTDKDLNIWAFVGTAESGYTKISKTFKVNRRNKPADYVFTPADQITLQTIQSQIGDLADLTTEAKDTLVAAINEAARTGGGGGGSTVELDTTLTQSGKAADAAAVGEQLSSLSSKIADTADAKVAAHNTGTDTHSDIRLMISGLTDRLNALADSDDTTLDQLSEVVAYIKSNRTLIEAITTNKVSVADIVDNLTTNVANKPLSAAQGVALKALIDAISIPDKLPNPNALTFTGAVSGSYDGSAPLTVDIPSGGGGVGDSGWEYLGEFTNAEQPTFEIGKYNLFYVTGYATLEAAQSTTYLRPSIDGARHFPWTIAFNNASKNFFGLFAPYFSIAYVTNGSGYASLTDRGNATVSICESDDMSKGTAYITLSGGGASSANLTEYKMKIYGKP